MSNQILRAYSIKEVSKKINIPTGTIRQWEKDLNGLLNIPRTRQGARFYTDKEIMILEKIKEMREQNVSKDLIRNLFEKHVANDSEVPSESFKLTVQTTDETVNQTNEVIANPREQYMQELYSTMEQFKYELLHELKNELTYNRNEMITEIRDELYNTSLQNIKEISKSIQRSNEKRKTEYQEISNALTKSSERHSESIATLTDRVAKNSKATYEQLSKRIIETSKMTAKENKNTLNKVSKTVAEAKIDINKMVQTLDEKQEYLLERMNELKQSTEEIQHREEIFQGMLTSFREVAAAKTKRKKWWQGWK